MKYNVTTPATTFRQSSTSFNKQAPRAFEEDEEDESFQGVLGYFVNQQSYHSFTFTLDEEIKAPSYYRNVQNVLAGCGEGDTVEFKINSPGGLYSGLCTLLHAVATTKATTIATLVGECASAASMFALHCDHVQVGPFASMLCHNVRYGYAGKGNDVVQHVQHIADISTDLIEMTYDGFLSEQEISDLLNGKEIYLKASEISDRIDKRETLRDQEEEAALVEAAKELLEEVPEVPVKKTRKKE